MFRKILYAIFAVMVFALSAYGAPITERGQGIIIGQRFFQWESPWGDDFYAGNPNKTMAKKGCLVTSLAMLFRYYGLTYIPDIDNSPKVDPLYRPGGSLFLKADPGSLNKWFISNKLFDSSDNLIPENAVPRFYLRLNGDYGYKRVMPNYDCRPLNDSPYRRNNCYKVDWSFNAIRLLDNDLDNIRPAIMKISWIDRSIRINHDSHFMLIGGYDQNTQSYRAYDPNKPYDKEKPLPPSLNYLYNQRNCIYTPLRVDRYQYEETFLGLPDLSSLSATAYSPVELAVIDPKGNMAGYDPAAGENVEGIPYASYSRESISSTDGDDDSNDPPKVLHIGKPVDGNYIFKVIGTGNGPYTIVFQGSKEDGSINVNTAITGIATPSLYETYRVTYSPTGEAILSQTNQAPIANAGSNQTGEQPYEIALDGSATRDPDGDPLKYTWGFVSKPDGSNASLSDAHAVNPTFTPDKAGTYVLQLVANDHFADSAPSVVTIMAIPLKSRISVTPNFSQPISAGNGFVTFDVCNIGRVGVSSGVIGVSLKDPDGTLIYAGSQNFGIGVGQTTTVAVPTTIPPLKFGNYTLTYTQSDETLTGGTTTAPIANSATASLSFDKVSYRVRETANLTLNIISTGKFKLDNIPVTITMPDAGYSETKNVGVEQSLQFAMPIPGTLAAGQHDVYIILGASTGATIEQNTKITIPESSLSIGYTGSASLSAGDAIPLTIENSGGADTTYASEKFVIADSKGSTIFQGNFSGVIRAGERRALSDVLLPAQIQNGSVTVTATIKDTTTGHISNSFVMPLQVKGLYANLSTRTDKELYLATEPVNILSSIENGQLAMTEASLKVSVTRTNPSATGKFGIFLPKENWWPFRNPSGIAAAPDGSFYVADSGNHRIQKFDSNRKLILQWGSNGTGDGQFNSPEGIAVAPDGSVFVADTWNYRIQKFDSNGSFIAKWGNKGYGNGQFSAPKGITVSPEGFIFVTDWFGHNVQKLDGNGNFIKKWGSYGSGNGQFVYPNGIAIDSNGFIFVTDNHRFQKFDSNGNFIEKVGGFCRTDTNLDKIPDQLCDGKFSNPWGIAIAQDDSIFIVDAGNYRIEKFDNKGNFLTAWGQYGHDDGQFVSPTEIAIVKDGTLYVSDDNINSIHKFDSNGNFVNKWGGYLFRHPYAMVIGRNKTIYVADSGSNRIVKFDESGKQLSKWGSTGSGDSQFQWPYAISINSDGSVIYVVDTFNNRIQKFDNNGNFIKKWGDYGYAGGQFKYPSGIAVAPNGYVYVTDTNNNRIQKFDSDGNFVFAWGNYGNGDGKFWNPSGISVDADGFVYVVDAFNHRIQKFDGDGNFIAKWGSYGSDIGQFSYPRNITIGLDGAMYIVDRGNNRIQKLDRNGRFIEQWQGSGEGEGQFNSPSGVTLGLDNAVYIVDTGNNRIQKMMASERNETLFEKTLHINQAPGSIQDYFDTPGAFNTPGKLYLQAELNNNLAQSISTSVYPFYIVNGNTLLLYKTDKKIYKPGETVTVAGEVRNLTPIQASDLTLAVRSKIQGGQSTSVYAETFNVDAGGSHPFNAVTTSGAEGTVTLIGLVSQNGSTLVEIADQYEVAAPRVVASVTGPSVAGNEPFMINVEMQNEGKTEAVVTLQSSVDGQLRTLAIPAGETRLAQYDSQIESTTPYTFTFTGDLNQTITKTVAYGLAAQIGVGSGTSGQGATMFPEGRLTIPVTITNPGQLAETLTVAYSIQPSGATEPRNYYLPAGATITDMLTYELASGSYQVSAVAVQPNATAQASFAVLKENDVMMTTVPGNQGSDGQIPVSIALTNNGSNTVAGNIALSVTNNDSKAIWRCEAQISGLQSKASTNITINVDPSGFPSGVYPVSTVLYSTSGRELAANQARIRTEGPIFEITSVPNNPAFTAGRNTSLAFAVKNTGTRQGEMNFAVKAMEVLNSNTRDVLQPGEEKRYAFAFAVPEEAEEKDYSANYVLTSALSQGTKGAAAFHVSQVKVGVTASLDKEAYRNGETAMLTMTVTRQSTTEDGTYLAIIRYGAYNDMKSFALGSQPVTFTFIVPLAEVTGESLFFGVHFESGREIFRNSLAVNEALPDLAAAFKGQAPEDGVVTPEIVNGNTIEVVVAVTNYGNTASEATTVALYNGDDLIDTKPVRGLNPAESESVSFVWNALRKAGDRTLLAVVDPQDTVAEFSEMNNAGTINVHVPDIAVFTATDKDNYKIRQKVYITPTITNFTLTPYGNLVLETTIKDVNGKVVYDKSTAVGSVPSSVSTTSAEIWNTAGLSVDGAYTINQTVLTGSKAITQSSKQVTLEKAPDFTLTVDVSSLKAKQGEKVVYTATLNPINGWNHETTLSLDDLPPGASAAFTPDKLLAPGESQVAVITTDSAAAGTHTIFLTAQGIDEGETVSHTVPLSLDVSAFGLETATPSRTAKQLEMAQFPINIISLNGYEGGVSLSVTGVPNGVQASIDSEHASVSGSTMLTVRTSKYAKPGAYTLTLTGDDGLVKHALDLSLVLQANPAIATGIITAQGPGPRNDVLIRSFNADLQLVREFTAFGTRYGASAITADLDGDGYDENIVAEGPDPGNTAMLRVFKRDGTLQAEYTAFNAKYGLTLATGDLDGDWVDELVVGTGPDPKNPGAIKVLKFNGNGFTELAAQTVYPDMTYGANVAVGDIDGDGLPEVITAPGPGPNNRAVVTIWKYAANRLTPLNTFTAFEGGYGANIAAGVMDINGKAEIVTGTGPDPKNTSSVLIYRGDGTVVKEFTPYDAKHTYGATIAAGDLDGDGVDEIFTGLGPGPQNEPLIKIFRVDGSEIGSFLAYPADTGYGVKVNSGRTGP